jgi:hypothetical protein
MNAPQAATLDYASDPATPQAGSNNFRVKLTGADGVAISGAQVTVTFFMPAMPAMGMAAMRNVVTLNEKGAGLYQGEGEVQMGGTYFAGMANGKAKIVRLWLFPALQGIRLNYPSSQAPQTQGLTPDFCGNLNTVLLKAKNHGRSISPRSTAMIWRRPSARPSKVT